MAYKELRRVVEVVAAVAVEVVEEEVAVEEVTVMGTTMIMTIPYLPIVRVLPDVDVNDEPTGSSTTPKCNDSWHKFYKINAKRPRVDTLRASQPPPLSR